MSRLRCWHRPVRAGCWGVSQRSTIRATVSLNMAVIEHFPEIRDAGAEGVETTWCADAP